MTQKIILKQKEKFFKNYPLKKSNRVGTEIYSIICPRDDGTPDARKGRLLLVKQLIS